MLLLSSYRAGVDVERARPSTRSIKLLTISHPDGLSLIEFARLILGRKLEGLIPLLLIFNEVSHTHHTDPRTGGASLFAGSHLHHVNKGENPVTQLHHLAFSTGVSSCGDQG